jgi:hypothetical protein
MEKQHTIRWYHKLISILTPISIKYIDYRGYRYMYLRKRIFHKGYQILDWVCLDEDTCFYISEKYVDSLNTLKDLSLHKD